MARLRSPVEALHRVVTWADSGAPMVGSSSFAIRRVRTRYAHLSSIPPMSAGAHVDQGQIIGRVGRTGCHGPHLHYEFC